MITTTKTDSVLHAMFTENTGIHGMDSGGSTGRHWQRWQGVTLEAALAMPDGMHDYNTNTPEYSVFWISSFHYLRKNLTVTSQSEDLTKRFREFVESKTVGDSYYNSAATLEDFLEIEFPGVEPNGWLTYNYDSFLDQDFSWYEIRQGREFDPVLVALSIHGGADIRGGYTDYVFFEAEHSYWVHGITDIHLECPKCIESGFISGMTDEYWEYTDNAFFNLAKGCPNCQGELTVFVDKFEI